MCFTTRILKLIFHSLKKSTYLLSKGLLWLYVKKKIKEDKKIRGCLQLWNFHSRVQLYTKKLIQSIFSCSIPHSFADLTHVIASWTLEEKFHINAHFCVILFIERGQNGRVCHTASMQNPWKVTLYNEFWCVSVAWSLSDRFSYEAFLHTLIWTREDVGRIW